MVCRHKIHCIVKKSFSCSNCKKCFTRKDSLEHLKVCTGIKAETKCTLCLKEFKFLCNLKRDMKQVHKTDKKSWSCKNMANLCFEKAFLGASNYVSTNSGKEKRSDWKETEVQLISMEDMVIFSLFKQYFSEDDEPVFILLCIKCASVCLT